jgi:hypothetical protein
MGERFGWARLETVGVFLVSLHSLLIGTGLVVASEWILDFAGWDEVHHFFFPRQSGVFHIILAVGYWVEHRRHGTIFLMALAKSAAVVFLLVMSPWREAWSVTFSGIADGLMLVGMWVVNRRARRTA